MRRPGLFCDTFVSFNSWLLFTYTYEQEQVGHFFKFLIVCYEIGRWVCVIRTTQGGVNGGLIFIFYGTIPMQRENV